jgi:hypothetical protein
VPPTDTASASSGSCGGSIDPFALLLAGGVLIWRTVSRRRT